MPLFAVHAMDKPDALALRLDHYPTHRAYLEAGFNYGVNVVLSGPLQSDDGETMIGSLFLIEATDHEAVCTFLQSDPFHQAGIWAEVRVNRFHRRRG